MKLFIRLVFESQLPCFSQLSVTKDLDKAPAMEPEDNYDAVFSRKQFPPSLSQLLLSSYLHERARGP